MRDFGIAEICTKKTIVSLQYFFRIKSAVSFFKLFPLNFSRRNILTTMLPGLSAASSLGRAGLRCSAVAAARTSSSSNSSIHTAPQWQQVSFLYTFKIIEKKIIITLLGRSSWPKIYFSHLYDAIFHLKPLQSVNLLKMTLQVHLLTAQNWRHQGVSWWYPNLVLQSLVWPPKPPLYFTLIFPLPGLNPLHTKDFTIY